LGLYLHYSLVAAMTDFVNLVWPQDPDIWSNTILNVTMNVFLIY
jgi:hypothetical protein